MKRCKEVHSAKETKPGGWKRYVDCRCDLKEGHDGSCRCKEHNKQFVVLRHMTVQTTASPR